MLYRVKHEKGLNHIAVVGVHPSIMDLPGAYVTTGNAANYDTDILPRDEGLAEIDWKVINSDWWNSSDGSKRKIMAESVTPPRTARRRLSLTQTCVRCWTLRK